MLYEVAVIGDCVQDMFIFAKSKLIKECGKKNKTEMYLSFLYGDKINIDELHFDLGGSACNAAVGMRKLRIKTTMVSMLGEDIYSRNVLEQLRNKKVGRSFLIKEKNKDLGLSFILLGPDRDRTILTYRPDNDFSKIKLKRLFWMSKSFYIAGINKYSKNIVREVCKYAEISGKKVYINPSGYQITNDLKNLKRILKVAKIVTVNVEEAMQILGIRKKIAIRDLLKNIKKLGPETIVITDGKKGAHVYDGKSFFKAGLYPSKRLDTTGAGDAFCSTFVAAQIKGYNLEDSLRLASINSGNVVSVYGAQRGLLNWNELNKKMKQKKVRVTKFK
jgi:sugar/nucleoside kinase (ribokinase family)